jgi:hypothetical protein
MYLCNLGKVAHSYANFCSRIKCNALNVILTMEALGLVGVVETSHYVSNSSALHDVMRFM